MEMRHKFYPLFGTFKIIYVLRFKFWEVVCKYQDFTLKNHIGQVSKLVTMK